MRWDSLRNWVPSLLDRVRYEKYFLETLPSVLQQLLAFGSRAIKPIQAHFWSQSHFYHLLESEIKTASQLILWNQNLVLNFKYYVVESFKYFIVIKTFKRSKFEVLICWLAGTSRWGHDEERHGARKVGVLPELSLGPQLDAQPGEADRADWPRQGQSRESIIHWF